MSQAGSAALSIMCMYQFILHCILLCIPSRAIYTNTAKLSTVIPPLPIILVHTAGVKVYLLPHLPLLHSSICNPPTVTSSTMGINIYAAMSLPFPLPHPIVCPLPCGTLLLITALTIFTDLKKEQFPSKQLTSMPAASLSG